MKSTSFLSKPVLKNTKQSEYKEKMMEFNLVLGDVKNQQTRQF